jgi:hypothetical protein
MEYRKQRNILLLFILLFGSGSFAQGIRYVGIVQDKQTKEPLAFVNLISSDGHYGTTTDIDGKFAFVLPVKTDSIRFSYLGYETLYVSTQKLKGPKTIYLKSREYDLSEYEVFPGINPAYRIISNVVQHRDLNNPQKLKSYAYTTYDKMVISIDTTSIKQDSAVSENDSIQGLKSFFKNKDLFLMETAVEKKFLAPDKSNEKVIATKVSGLKDPMMVYLVSQIQSTSFYDEIIHIANKNYINPISKGSLKKYYFQMEDTLYSGLEDSIFTISFRPRRNTNFEGLQGTMSISTHKWAIVNVKAEPAKNGGGIAVHIQQKYELVDGEHWFPVQLNTTITFDALSVGSGGQQSRLLGIGKTYIKDIELNPNLVKKAFSHIEVEIDPNAAYQKEKQWKSFRIDSLTERDRQTYHFMDSIGREAKFDKKLKELETLLTGKVSWAYFDFLLNHFVGYNSFEGFWFGLGVQTNKLFSQKLSFGGYYAYSLKDKRSKFSANVSALLYKPADIKAHLEYLSDNIESGHFDYLNDENSLFDPLAFQRLFVNRMNFTRSEKLGLSWRMFKYLQVYAGLNHQAIEAVKPYWFQRPQDVVSFRDFQITEMQLKFRYAYKERFFDNGRMTLSMGTKYPILWLNVTQAVSNLFGGDFKYQKLDLQLRKSFYTKYLGETRFSLKAGMVLGDVPYAKLYSAAGTYRPLTLCAPGSFGTMRANEFLSDSYVSLFIAHNFGSLLFKGKKFKPEFEVHSNIGFGWLKHPEFHHAVDFNTMEKGYYESGLIINKLVHLYLFDLGIGGLYRYGPYRLGSFKDNVAAKFTITFPMKTKFSKAGDN